MYFMQPTPDCGCKSNDNFYTCKPKDHFFEIYTQKRNVEGENTESGRYSKMFFRTRTDWFPN